MLAFSVFIHEAHLKQRNSLIHSFTWCFPLIEDESAEIEGASGNSQRLKAKSLKLKDKI